MDTNIITQEKIIKFEQLANNGARRVSDSLSIIVGEQVDIVTVKNRILLPEEIYQHIGGKDGGLFTMVAFSISNVPSGFALVVFSEEDKDRLVTMMLEKNSADSSRECSKDSIIKESSNIIVGAFLSEFHKKFDLNLIQSVPNIATDTLKAMLDEIIAEIIQTSQNILVLETKIRITPQDILGKIFIVSDVQLVEKMFQE
jgi:chemotaxis protein CheY-P-specific phosphatase CheC